MLQGSGISTYLMGLIRIYKKKHQSNLNYLVKNYTRVISNSPDYKNQYPFKSNIYINGVCGIYNQSIRSYAKNIKDMKKGLEDTLEL